MVVISKSTLVTYGRQYVQAISAINNWYETVNKADWSNLAEVRRDFNSVDYVGNDRYVFNLKGNQFRIVAMIHFSTRTLYIRFIGTHKAYDRINASTI